MSHLCCSVRSMDINILVGLPPNANDHSQLTSLRPDVKPCDNHAQCRAYTIPYPTTMHIDGRTQWPAYRARLRVKADKQGNRPSKASDRARLRIKAKQHGNRHPKACTEHDHKSKPKKACQSTSESQILPTTIVRLIPFQHNPLLIYPTGGYQHNTGTSANYISVGDR